MGVKALYRVAGNTLSLSAPAAAVERCRKQTPIAVAPTESHTPKIATAIHGK